MSLKIYLDDCAAAKKLVNLLRQAGHQVVTPTEAGISAQPDEVHLRYAAQHGLVLLTKNPRDFGELHKACQEHLGIFAVYQDNDPNRDMSNGDIVKAIANLENAAITFPGSFQVLNAWRY